MILLANLDSVVKEEQGWKWAGGAGISTSMLMKNANTAATEKE